MEVRRSIDSVKATFVTVSTTPQRVGSLGRRNHIRIYNMGSVDVYVVDSVTASIVSGYPIAPGTSWADDTSAPIYLVVGTGSAEVRIYERGTRIIVNG